MLKTCFVLSTLVAVVYCNGDPNDVQATVLNYKNELKSDGSYAYGFISSNGLDIEESGIGSSHATGSFAYTSPEGQLIKLSYIADEHGYHPTGDHLPTPPPTPDYILRSLAYIAEHPYDKFGKSNEK